MALNRNKTVSTRVTDKSYKDAKNNLAKQGVTISEYIRLALSQAASNHVQLINFLGTPEAQYAKYEAEHGKTNKIGNLKDFDRWIDKIDKN